MELVAPTDAELVQGLRSGDQQAFQQFYRRYERPLFQFVQRYLKNPEEAEEVFHDVMMKVMNHHSVDYLGDSVRGWLYVTARNMALNRIRKKTRGNRVFNQIKNESDLFTDDLESLKIRSDLTDKVRQRSEKLSEEQREMLQMRLQGMTNREIAEAKNVPEGTIKSRFHAIVNYLRKGFSQ